MRLEPVYLVAPKEKPPSIATRRAFLLTGGALVAGLGVGGASGFAAASIVSAGKPGAARDRAGYTAESAELRRLALHAPIAELMDKAMLFLNLLRDSYPDDVELWRGAERIAIELRDNERAAHRRTLARWLLQLSKHAPAAAAATLQSLAPDLRRIR